MYFGMSKLEYFPTEKIQMSCMIPFVVQLEINLRQLELNLLAKILLLQHVMPNCV